MKPITNIFMKNFVEQVQAQDQMNETICDFSLSEIVTHTEEVCRATGSPDIPGIPHPLVEAMKKANPDAVILTGFDDCIMGICNRVGGAIFIYDQDKIVDKIAEYMEPEEAFDYFIENILSVDYGEFSPVYFPGLGEEAEGDEDSDDEFDEDEGLTYY